MVMILDNAFHSHWPDVCRFASENCSEPFVNPVSEGMEGFLAGTANAGDRNP